MAPLLVSLVPFAAAREDRGGQAALSDTLQRSIRYAILAIVVGTTIGLFVAGPFMVVWSAMGGPPRRTRSGSSSSCSWRWRCSR